jgi:RND family efflux transporter MFP subunit
MHLQNHNLDSWLALLEEDREPVFFSAWMNCLIGGLSHVKESALVVGSANVGPFMPVAFWPHKAPCSQALGVLCEQVLDMRRPIQRQESSEMLLALPIMRGKDIYGVIGLGFSGQMPNHVREWVQWGIGWLLARPTSAGSMNQSALTERMLLVMDVLLVAMTQDGLSSSAQAATTVAAQKLGCDRVSLGLGKGKSIELIALSHAADFSRRVDLTQALEDAMHEAADQGAAISLTLAQLSAEKAITDMQVTRAHVNLLRNQGNVCALTVPFWIDTDRYGALVYEWQEAIVSDELLSVAEGLAPVLGRVILDKQSAQTSVWRRMWQGIRHPLQALLGEKSLGLKLTIIALITLFTVLALTPAPFKLSASSTLEGSTRRVLAAPFDGFVSGAFYRAGQLVHQGDLLASLDARTLKLESSRWASQQEQYLKQAQDALAQRNLAQAQIANAQAEQAQAQRELVEEQLRYTQIVAPFDGVLVSGDLSQSLGAAVQKGQTLFEVAPMDSYRLVLWVHEGDMAHIRLGQQGTVVLTALTNVKFDFEVTLITPVAVVEEGSNVFRVEAKLIANAEQLRPGMQGVGKVMVGEASLLWIWSRQAVNWGRLQVWRWFGI